MVGKLSSGEFLVPLDQAAMDVSDVILVVTQLDLPSLRNAVRLLQYLKRRPGLYDKVKVVINRMGLDDNAISLNKAFDTLGREIYAQIPNDYATMVEARNNGARLVTQSPKAKLTKSIIQLAQSLDAPVTVEEKADDRKLPARKEGLFSFLGSGDDESLSRDWMRPGDTQAIAAASSREPGRTCGRVAFALTA